MSILCRISGTVTASRAHALSVRNKCWCDGARRRENEMHKQREKGAAAFGVCA